MKEAASQQDGGFPEKLLFCHIPKSAGTTMGQILDRNYGRGFYPYYGLWDKYMFNADDIEGMCALHPHFDCIASHLFSLDIPYKSQRFDFHALSLVRDPVDRALSLYFYNFRLARENPGYVPPGNIESFFEPILKQRSDGRFFDAQWKFLTHGFAPDFSMGDMMTLVRDCRRVLLAPVDRFDDLCLLLEFRYPERIRNAAYGKNRNRSSREEAVPERLVERLRDANPRDTELCELVRNHFANLVCAELGDGERIEEMRRDFSERCRRQAVVDAAAQKAKELLGDLLGKD